MRDWLIKTVLTHAVKNYRTFVPGVIGFLVNMIPGAQEWIIARGYDMNEFNGIVILFIAFFAKDGSVSNAPVPGPAKSVLVKDPRGLPSGGNARLWLLVLLAAILGGVLMAPRWARAQSVDPTAANSDPGAVIADAVANSYPDRKFGGCSRSGFICAGPSGTVSLVAWDIDAKRWVTGFQPTLAYGIDFWAQDWWKTGLALGAGIAMQNGTMTSGTISANVSFAEYLRFGYALEVIGSTDTTPYSKRGYLLFGFGADFGN